MAISSSSNADVGALRLAPDPAPDAAPIAFVDLAIQQARIRSRIDLAIAAVLDHGQYIMGPEVKALEQKLSEFCGARYALGCASGTDALMIAMMAMGVGAGDAVLCPAFTYTATPETIAVIGATPVFVDVDEATFNIAPEGIAAGVAAARVAGLRPVGLIAVDLFGLPADYEALDGIATENDLWLMADGAQSFGASRANQAVGTFGRVTATSFFPAKPLGCYGDGGALFTDDASLAATMDSIRLHGKAVGGDKYDIARIGVNGRLDTIQAAILIEKLAIFSDELELRRQVAQRYTDALSDVVATPRVMPGSQSSWAQYTLRIPAGQRAHVAAALKRDGIPTAVYYPRPLHHQEAYRRFPVSATGLPVSEKLSQEVLSLPMHPYLKSEQQARVAGSVRRALRDI